MKWLLDEAAGEEHARHAVEALQRLLESHADIIPTAQLTLLANLSAHQATGKTAPYGLVVVRSWSEAENDFKYSEQAEGCRPLYDDVDCSCLRMLAAEELKRRGA